MNTDQALLRLDAHQRSLLDHLDQSLALLFEPPAAAREPLAHARWILVRMLHAYQVFKHAEIFDPAIRRGTPAQVQLATRLKADCIAASENYRAFVRVWSASDVVARWDEYRPAMLAIADQLRAHLSTERRTVADLLAGSTRTRRLAG